MEELKVNSKKYEILEKICELDMFAEINKDIENIIYNNYYKGLSFNIIKIENERHFVIDTEDKYLIEDYNFNIMITENNYIKLNNILSTIILSQSLKNSTIKSKVCI